MEAKVALTELLGMVEGDGQADVGLLGQMRARLIELTAKLSQGEGPDVVDPVFNTCTLKSLGPLDLTKDAPMILRLKGDGHCCIYGLLTAMEDAYFGSRKEKSPGYSVKQAMGMRESLAVYIETGQDGPNAIYATDKDATESRESVVRDLRDPKAWSGAQAINAFGLKFNVRCRVEYLYTITRCHQELGATDSKVMVCFLFTGSHYNMVQFEDGTKYSCVISVNDIEQCTELEKFVEAEYKAEITTNPKYAALVAGKMAATGSGIAPSALVPAPAPASGASPLCMKCPSHCSGSTTAGPASEGAVKGDFIVKISGCPGKRDLVLKKLLLSGVDTSTIKSLGKSKGLRFRDVTFDKQEHADAFREEVLERRLNNSVKVTKCSTQSNRETEALLERVAALERELKSSGCVDLSSESDEDTEEEHLDEPRARARNIERRVSQARRECPFYRRGYCRDGEDCDLLHTTRKNRPGSGQRGPAGRSRRNSNRGEPTARSRTSTPRPSREHRRDGRRSVSREGSASRVQTERLQTNSVDSVT